MRVLFTPQIPLDGDSIEYTFDEDIIHAKAIYQGRVYRDSFDFKGLPDGELKMYDENGNETIQTELPISVLLGAKRVNGELRVELLNWISSDASEEERFPNWIDSDRYVEYLNRVRSKRDRSKIEEEKQKLTKEEIDGLKGAMDKFSGFVGEKNSINMNPVEGWGEF